MINERMNLEEYDNDQLLAIRHAGLFQLAWQSSYYQFCRS